MAKRHESLILLARDHHEALLLALRLQQGTLALLRLWTHDPVDQAKRVVAFYDQHLRRHFAEEELIVFAIARKNLPASEPIIDTLVAEHRTMEVAISKFRSANKESLEDDLRAFGALLESHIRTEDRSLFPLIESQASQTVLNDIQYGFNFFEDRRL